MTGNSRDLKKCDCHGDPMLWVPDARYQPGGFWRCRRRTLAQQRALYASMSGVRYNHKLLVNRRNKARARQRARHDHPGVNVG